VSIPLYSRRNKLKKKKKKKATVLTVIPGINRGKELAILFYEVCQFAEENPAFRNWEKLPGGMFESLTRCPDGNVNVTLPGRLDSCNFILSAVKPYGQFSVLRNGILYTCTCAVVHVWVSDTYAGSIEMRVPPSTDGTNSLLIKRPVG